MGECVLVDEKYHLKRVGKSEILENEVRLGTCPNSRL